MEADALSVSEELAKLRGGEQEALARLVPLMYRRLRAMARVRLSQEAVGHTLQPTALVHELYLQMVGQSWRGLQDQAHFYAIAALLMRRILVRHVRDRRALKRGGSSRPLSLSTAYAEVVAVAEAGPNTNLLALDTALDALAGVDPDLARVVELRYFAGLSVEQCAEALHVSVATVHRRWVLARSWLRQYLSDR